MQFHSVSGHVVRATTPRPIRADFALRAGDRVGGLRHHRVHRAVHGLAHLVAIQFAFAERATPVLVLLVGLLFTTLAYWEAKAVVRRAEAAPEPPRDPARGTTERRATSDTGTDPIAELRHRYANGDLSTEVFEERVDRLVEMNDRSDDSDLQDPELERA